MALRRHLSANLRAQLTIIRTKVERIWASQRHRYFTDHQIEHSERIIQILDAITAELMGSDRRLNSQEVFVLLASAYLHDVGMQWEKGKYRDSSLARKDHHLLSYKMIVGSIEEPSRYPDLGIEQDYVYEIALVSKGHRQVDLYNGEYDDAVKRGNRIRLRLLAALLRLADELDIDERRIYIDLLKVANVPQDSRVHWWKCHYVSGVDIELNGQITIHYRVPRQKYIEPLVLLVETDLRDKFECLQNILWDNLVRLRICDPKVVQAPGKIEMSDEDYSYVLEQVCGKTTSPVSSSASPLQSSYEEPAMPQLRPEPDALAGIGWEEGQKTELEHARELYREKSEYAHQLELEEARQGISFPTARRLELERCKKELNDLRAKIRGLAMPTSTPSSLSTVAPSTGLIVNPGFEEDFIGWREDPDQFQYGSQSIEDTTEVHGGQRSRKLFLCWGGSHIIQDISLATPLPAKTEVTLKAWVKMPHPGSQSNKWFTLELAAVSVDGRGDSKSVDQYSVLPDWSQLSVGPLVTKFPVMRLEIHAMTSKGDGSHKSHDRPVWVDDFELDIRPATQNTTVTEVTDLAAVGPTKLRQAMHCTYDRPAFEILCKELGLDYHDLRGETLETKMLYLIDWHQRHRQYVLLVHKVLKDHPSLTQELLE